MTVARLEHALGYSAEIGRLIALSRRKEWFPNVFGIHVIAWDEEEMDELHWVYPYYPLFPSLRQIRIDCPIHMTYNELAYLVDWCPTIEYLRIVTDTGYANYDPIPPALLLRFQYLQHVELNLGECKIDDPPMIHLLSLGSVRQLKLTTEDWELGIISLESGCQKLREMQLFSKFLDLTQLLHDLRIPNSILTLSLKTHQDLESEEAWSTFWQGCIALVVERFADSLKHLSLCADQTKWPIRHAITRGLKTLTHLEELQLHNLTDIVDLRQTLPQLRVFWSC
jgi:hypothetical protein